MYNDVYESMLEGRFPFSIDTHELADGNYQATFTSGHGETVTVEDSSLSEAHRLCTAKIMEGIKDGTIIIFR